MLSFVIATLIWLQQAPVIPEQTNTPPASTAVGGDVEKTKETLAEDQNISGVDPKQRTALFMAGQQGKKAAFAEIVATARENVKKQIARLPIEGQSAVVPSMQALQNRVDLFNGPDKDGTTPLMLAAAQGWDDLARALIEGGARPQALDKNGRSAANYAEVAGSFELADFLRTATASIP
jgi:ankyrin repeat protein